MSKYLISFPSAAMDIAPDELPDVAEAAHRVVREAKRAGVWVFGGGIDERIAPVLVAADGSVTPGTYPQTATIEGGYAVVDVASYDAAVDWAAKFAAACRCAQELRVFGDDAES
jgi:hypothetical protein